MELQTMVIRTFNIYAADVTIIVSPHHFLKVGHWQKRKLSVASSETSLALTYRLNYG